MPVAEFRRPRPKQATAGMCQDQSLLDRVIGQHEARSASSIFHALG
jgi:hypothetical protein